MIMGSFIKSQLESDLRVEKEKELVWEDVSMMTARNIMSFF